MTSSERKVPKEATLAKWRTEFKWLTTDGKLQCSLCLKFNEKLICSRNYNPIFVTGSENYRLSAIRDHQGSVMHEKAVDYENAEQFGEQYKKQVSMQIPENAALKIAFNHMSEVERKRMVRLFELACYIGHNARPYSDFSGLVELEKLHGVDLPTAYANENGCKDFLHEISTVLFDEQVKSKLQRSHFISVLCDGTTDIAVVEKEVIYVAFVDPDTFQPTVVYFGLKSVESQDAPGIKPAICRAFREADLETCLNHIVFLASDGASANSGMFKGLIAQMKIDYPWLVFIWCVSHWLELAIKDSLKVPMQTAEEPLRDLYSIYHRSSKKLRELRLLFEVLKEVYDFEDGQVRPSKACGTRWIDHKVRAMKGFVDKLGVYVQHLDNVIADTSKATDKASLLGKVKRMKSAKVLLLCALFVGLLDVVRRVSLQSQKSACNLLKMVECLDDAILHYELLHRKLVKSPEHVFTFPVLKSVIEQITNDDCYHGVQLTYVNAAKDYIQNNMCQYIGSIVTCLRERYGILVTNPWTSADEEEEIKESVTAALREGDTVVHQVCTILDTRTWILPNHDPEISAPATDSPDNTTLLSLVLDRQLSAVDKVYNQYKLILTAESSETIQTQFIGLVNYAIEHLECQAFSPLQLWQMLHKVKKHLYPQLFELVELCMCCPYTNAELERFFSRMACVKTDLRNNLKEQNLEDLCRVLLGPPLVEFSSSSMVAAAVDKWYNSKKRRLNQTKRKPYKQRESNKRRSIDCGELTLLQLFEESDSTDGDNDTE